MRIQLPSILIEAGGDRDAALPLGTELPVGLGAWGNTDGGRDSLEGEWISPTYVHEFRPGVEELLYPRGMAGELTKEGRPKRGPAAGKGYWISGLGISSGISGGVSDNYPGLKGLINPELPTNESPVGLWAGGSLYAAPLSFRADAAANTQGRTAARMGWSDTLGDGPLFKAGFSAVSGSKTFWGGSVRLQGSGLPGTSLPVSGEAGLSRGLNGVWKIAGKERLVQEPWYARFRGGGSWGVPGEGLADGQEEGGTGQGWAEALGGWFSGTSGWSFRGGAGLLMKEGADPEDGRAEDWRIFPAGQLQIPLPAGIGASLQYGLEETCLEGDLPGAAGRGKLYLFRPGVEIILSAGYAEEMWRGGFSSALWKRPFLWGLQADWEQPDGFQGASVTMSLFARTGAGILPLTAEGSWRGEDDWTVGIWYVHLW